MKPPVKSMEGLWSESEKEYVLSRFRLGVRGGRAKVKAQIAELRSQTDCDEMMFTTAAFDQAKRLRSYSIIADVLK
jgi:hypothetical protein